MKTLQTLVCGIWFVFCAFAVGCWRRDAAETDLQSQEKKLAGKGIDAATVAAYEKLGATYGGMTTNPDGFLAFMAGPQIAQRYLPAFSFKSDLTNKLPEVRVPFGLVFAGGKISDAGLRAVVGLTKLKTLDLNATKVRDAGLKHLAGLKQLQWIYLDNTEVTDAGLKELAGLGQLQSLSVRGTDVTDAGLKELAGLKQLQMLYLGGTQVTNTGVGRLQKVLPSLRISHK